jgi:hypothetical protein
MVRRSRAFEYIRRAARSLPPKPSIQRTSKPAPSAASSACFSRGSRARVLIGRRCTLRVWMDPSSGLGVTAASGTKRTSNSGRSSLLPARRAISVRKPWALAAIAMVSSRAPCEIWLGRPAKS